LISTLELSEIYKPIRSDLDRFHKLLQEELSSKDKFLQEIQSHLMQISGKHLRPALAILSARISGNTSDVPVRLAIAIELLHTATLIHDDIIDGSMLRRNQPSVNARWGIEVSIICGDYLYSKAFSILASMEDPNINKMFAACAKTMCEGEMKQVETRKTLAMTEAEYTDIIHKKTASLFQAACAVGAYVSKKSIPEVAALGDYGKNLGLAFQLTDDILDIVAKDETLGKKAGLDFEKKDPTLPLIYMYQTLAPRRGEIDALIHATNGQAEQSFQKIKELCVQSGAVERCIRRAKDHATAAHDNLKHFPDSPYKKSLTDLVDFTVQRV